MDFAEVVNIALPIVYVLVGAALVWLVIELVLTIRKTRSTVEDIKKQVEPTLANVEELTNGLKPVVAKVDPLVERVSLTVDAANLEIMRVDQILDDVNDITGSLSSAVEAVDTAANAPLELVTSVSNKVRSVFKPRKASPESVDLGNEKNAGSEAPTAEQRSKTVVEAAQDTVKAAATVAQDVAQAAGEGVDEAHAHTQQRKADREAAVAARHAAADKANTAASHMADAMQAVAESDAAAVKDKYFTYDNVAAQPGVGTDSSAK